MVINIIFLKSGVNLIALDSAIRNKNGMNNFSAVIHRFILTLPGKYLKPEVRFFQNIIGDT